MFLAANPRLQAVAVDTPSGTEFLRIMLLDRDGFLARIDDVGIRSDLTYGDVVRLREVGGRLHYAETVEQSDYNAYVAVARPDDTKVAPRLAAIQGVAVRILRTPDAAIVSVAAPPHTKDALERELRLLVTEMRLRDLVHVVAR